MVSIHGGASLKITWGGEFRTFFQAQTELLASIATLGYRSPQFRIDFGQHLTVERS
jgi:hypothetical protein